MNVKTSIEAGFDGTNHNETLLRVPSQEKDTGRNDRPAPGLKVKTGEGWKVGPSSWGLV